MKVIFPAKRVGTVYQAVFDFTAQLQGTDTIVSAGCTSVLYTGTDTAASILSGSPAISNPQVTQNIANGVVGNVYQVSCRATTAAGAVLELVGFIAISQEAV